MKILIPELYCVYKTRNGFECVCSYKYPLGSSEMIIITAQWIKENNKFYLDEEGHLEGNARNHWISGINIRNHYSKNNSFELVEKLTYLRGETYNWDDY